MTSPALRHLVEHVHVMQGPGLDAAFPSCFDWQRLVRDTPAVAERASEGRLDVEDAAWAHALQARADELFRMAHLATLVVFSAADADGADPEALLTRFFDPPDDEEEERFADLAVDVLGPVEESLAASELGLDERGLEARGLVLEAWPAVEEMLAESGLLDVDAGPDPADLEPARAVLHALARVAAILAALRWMSAYSVVDGHPD